MDLKDIATVSGKPGLYRVLKPTRTGVILESLDEKRNKLIANANSRVSILQEISVYTLDAEGAIPLEQVFEKINEKYEKELPVSSKSSEAELRDFIEKIVPDYDSEKVYKSDLKKLVSWYNLLWSHFPEKFEQKEEETKDEKTKAEDKEEKSAKK